jgi:hypothetical protein
MPGKCGRCDKQVYDAEEVKAAGRVWHSGCFKCKDCGAALNSSTLRDREGEIYCQHCYGKLFGAKGYGFGGGGGVGLASGKYDGADPVASSDAINADIKRKLEAKYDQSQEAKCRAWLEEFLGEKFQEATLQEALKSGVRLCKAINKVTGGVIKQISDKQMAAMQRENIARYLQVCKNAAFNRADIFETDDLFLGKNMVLVLANIRALSEKAVAKKASSSAIAGAGAAPPVEVAAPGAYGGGVGGVRSEPAEPVAAEPAAEPAAAEPAASGGGGGGGGGGGEVCPDCGAERGSGADFCADCGHKF